MDTPAPPQGPSDEPESLLAKIVRLYETNQTPEIVDDRQLGRAKVYPVGTGGDSMYILVPLEPKPTITSAVPIVYSRRSHLEPRQTYWQIDTCIDNTFKIMSVINLSPDPSEKHKEEIIEIADELMRNYVAEQ